MWKRNIDWLPPICTLIGDQTNNLGICPDWESNPLIFGIQDDAPTNWATQMSRDDVDHFQTEMFTSQFITFLSFLLVILTSSVQTVELLLAWVSWVEQCEQSPSWPHWTHSMIFKLLILGSCLFHCITQFILIIQFCRRGQCHTKRLSNSFKVTQLLNGEPSSNPCCLEP